MNRRQLGDQHYQDYKTAEDARDDAEKKALEYVIECGVPNYSDKNIGVAHWELRIGSWLWECPDSPLGRCIYHRFDDPACDDCLYCGMPLERK